MRCLFDPPGTNVQDETERLNVPSIHAHAAAPDKLRADDKDRPADMI